jgi:hypothetical protein
LEEGRALPSPNQLKGKILIKNKKLKPEQEAEGESAYGKLILIHIVACRNYDAI